ncbi:unnamed protein product, partial [Polarella glacialis]
RVTFGATRVRAATGGGKVKPGCRRCLPGAATGHRRDEVHWQHQRQQQQQQQQQQQRQRQQQLHWQLPWDRQRKCRSFWIAGPGSFVEGVLGMHFGRQILEEGRGPARNQARRWLACERRLRNL